MGFDDTGLGEAMSLAHARDTAEDAKKLVRKQDRRIEDLEQRIIDLELQVSQCLDASRFLYRYYVDNERGAKWPL